MVRRMLELLTQQLPNHQTLFLVLKGNLRSVLNCLNSLSDKLNCLAPVTQIAKMPHRRTETPKRKTRLMAEDGNRYTHLKQSLNNCCL